jgi:DNA-binding NtrC family response regulator
MTAATESSVSAVSAVGSLEQSVRSAQSVTASVHVFVVDDDAVLREACASFFRAQGYTVSTTGSGDEALERVKRRRFDLILLDLYMSQVSGPDILAAALEANRDTLVVVMTGNPSVESNLHVMQAGAWEYLLKPFSPTHLEVIAGRGLYVILSARDGRADALRALRDIGNSDLVTCIGVSPTFRGAVELARKVAITDASVLLSGESGTGKEVLAQVIHRHSRRATKRLVPINCAAMPENLLESEMFGHRRGSFTGAERDKPGLLEMAHKGTLFLDELTDMSQRLQAKLLRVIQDGVVRRVGSERQDAVVDVRFVSATNRDPEDAVSQGVLREDLFYRLRVVPIHLPPLRERSDDIPLLANHFLAHYWRRYRGTRDAPPKFTASSMDHLRSNPWRGNVRELQNVIEHIAVLAEPGQAIRPVDIPFRGGSVRPTVQAENNGPSEVVAEGNSPSNLDDDNWQPGLLDDGYYTARDKLVADFERAYLSRLVGRAEGNMSKAARLASIDRTTLYRLMERHSLYRGKGELVERRRMD